jgi:hypothetical protein
MLLTLALPLFLFFHSEAKAFEFNELDLKNNMKQNGIALKAITTTINDVSKNKENASLALKMIGYFESAKNQIPQTVDPSSIADYQSLMELEIKNLKDLQEAFLNNDNVGALSIIQKLNAVKKEGHDKYK